MADNYTTPLARAARIMEIIIPCYMFGKAWGIADEKTVDLFRAMFPAFLVNMAEFFKGVMHTDNANIQRFFSTMSGALVGFVVIALLALVMHLVLRDRKYINSLRFTAVSLIPIAVLNGTLSHAIKTLVENLGSQTPEALYASTVSSSQGNLALDGLFYLTAMWFLARRTGVKRSKRVGVVCVGLVFMIIYIGLGLMISPAEWQALLPKLQQALATH
jgi:hypothetical protein